MTTDDRRTDFADLQPDDPTSPAGAEQRAEQERLDEETARRFAGDPGDPKDRLSSAENDRLMEQQQERDLHA